MMTEGFSRGFGLGVREFAQNLQGFNLARDEVQRAGEALDTVLHSRASAFLDWGHSLAEGGLFDKAMHSTAGIFSYLNLLNPWNDFMKSWAGAIAGSRMIEESKAWAAGIDRPVEREKLARSGIDESMARRIAAQFEQHGVFGDGVLGSDAAGTTSSLHVANTPAWDDEVARDAFRSALVAEVNRAIVTPGVGDTPLWTSSQLGSLITQFKRFGMAATQRILISGLQQDRMNWWTGAAALTGAGMIADKLKDIAYDGDGERDRSWQERLVRGMDRSAVLGWPLDVNRALERIAGVGIGPMLGEERQHYSTSAKVGSVLGPTADQIGTALHAVVEGVHGKPRQAVAAASRLVPFQGIWYMQPEVNALVRGVGDLAAGASPGG
jgi:hypothetical protein